MTTERDTVLADFDLPVTDDFVRGVRRGVRRRKVLRGAAAGAATLAVAGVVASGVALAGGGGDRVAPPAAPRASASLPALTASLDGFEVTRLPEGTVRAAGSDGYSTNPVTAEGLQTSTDAAIGDPAATLTIRRFDRGAGMGMFVAVMRPSKGDAATVGGWILAGELRGEKAAATFDTPVGQARLFTYQGSETTVHRVVIAGPDHVVITIEANGTFTADQLRDVAQGIRVFN